MFPRSFADGDVKIERHPESLVAGTHSQGTRNPVVSAFRQASGVIEAALARLGALPYDSRDSLRSKEQQLAAFGISWATDAAYDAGLAQELAAARLRRQECPAVAAPAQPLVPAATVNRGLRWSVGMLLIRAGCHLQGGQSFRTAV